MIRAICLTALVLGAACAPQLQVGLRPVSIARTDAASISAPAGASDIAWVEGNDRAYAKARLDAGLAADPTSAPLLLRRALLAETDLDHDAVLAGLTATVRHAPRSDEGAAALTLLLDQFSSHAINRAQMLEAISAAGLLGPGRSTADRVAMASLVVSRALALDRAHDGMREAVTRGGWITAMKVVGPIGSKHYTSLDKPTAAESEGVAPTTYRGRTVGVRTARAWRAAISPTSSGLEGLYVAEVWVSVEAGSAEDVVVQALLHTPARVSVDGVPLISRTDEQRRQPTLGTARLRLAEGWHRISVATLSAGSQSFSLSILGADGSRVLSAQSLEAPPKPAAPPTAVAATQPATKAQLSAFDRLIRTRLALTSWGRDVEGARRALRPLTATASTSAALSTLEARLMSIEGLGASLVTAQLRRALALDPTSPQLLMMMARSIRRDTPDRALELADRAAAHSPGAAEPDALRFRVMRSRRWSAEAKASLQAALQKRPSFALLAEGARFYRGLWRIDEAKALEARALSLAEPGPGAGEAKAFLQAGDLDGAIDAYRRAMLTSASPQRWLHLIAALELSRGRTAEARAAATETLAIDPMDREALRHLASASALLADVATATASLAKLRLLDVPDVGLETFDAELLGRTPGAAPVGGALAQALAIDAVALAQAQVDPSWSKNAQIRLLDRHVDYVRPDGHALTITHLIERLQTKEATDASGEYRLGDGDLALALRTIKADGTVVDVDRHPGKPDLSFSALAPGDSVEKKILSIEPPATIEGGFMRRFYFQDDVPNLVSELVVVVDEGTDVKWRSYHGAPEPTIADESGKTVYIFRARNMAGIPSEPNSVQHEEYLPFVAVTIGLDEAQARAANVAPFRGFGRSSFDVDRVAETIIAGHQTERARTEAIFRWVVDNVEHGGPADPTVTLHTKRGDRVSLILAMLKSAGLDAALVLGRRAAQTIVEPPYPDPRKYLTPIIAVRCADEPSRQSIWIRVDSKIPWMGLATEDLAGGEYLPLDGGPPVPFRDDQVAAWVLESNVDAVVDAAGNASGTVDITLPGVPGQSIRGAVSSMRTEALDRSLEGWVSSIIPGAVRLKTTVEGLDDRLAPMRIRVEFAAEGFLTMAGSKATVHRFFDAPIASGAVGIPPIESYLRVGRRNTPLYVWPSAERTKVKIRFDAPLERIIERPTTFERRTAWGYFTQSMTWDEATSVVRFSRTRLTKGTRIPVQDFDGFRDTMQELILQMRGRLVFDTR